MQLCPWNQHAWCSQPVWWPKLAQKHFFWFLFLVTSFLHQFTGCLHRDRLVNLEGAGLWQGLLPRGSALFSPGGQLGREQGTFRSASTWRAVPRDLMELNGPLGALQILSRHLTNSNQKSRNWITKANVLLIIVDYQMQLSNQSQIRKWISVWDWSYIRQIINYATEITCPYKPLKESEKLLLCGV